MASVELKSIRKSYGKTQVVHGIDLSIADGEFIVVVGPSGCGKSTLLRMVAGLEEISAGDLSIDGRVVNRLEPKDRDIAMVFQNYALYPHMTVFDNMAYGLRIRGLSAAEIEAQVKRAAGILQLEPYLQRKPRELSGGQRQRVAMGRAIVRQPKVFLFDEPLSNLDAKLRVQMRIEIKRLHQELGVTSIYVTHDQIEAMTLADRLVVMHGGIAEQIGEPKSVYNSPATTFVAGFIGSPSMNFLPGQASGPAAVALDDGSHVDFQRPHGVAEGHAVIVGIRPEHIRLADPARAHFTLRVDLAEELGADTIVYGRVGSADLVVRLPGYLDLPPGSVLALDLDPAMLHLFDRDTGRRI